MYDSDSSQRAHPEGWTFSLPSSDAMFVHILALFIYPFLTSGQNLTVPWTWVRASPLPLRALMKGPLFQNSSNFYTRDERISLAQGAIDRFINDGFPSGTISTAIAGGNSM
jgi:hypothetical protein